MSHDAISLGVLALVGACAGSFAATAGLRIVRGEQFVAGRSHCDGCGRPLGIFETAPVLAFVARRGACSTCHAPIDRAHLIGELAGAAMAAASYVAAPPLRALALTLLGMILLTSAVVDLRSYRLPDPLTLGAAVLGLGLSLARSPMTAFWGCVWAVGAFAVMEAVRRGYAASRGAAGLGQGDVKLVAALALWLGPATPFALTAAALLGLLQVVIVRPAGGRIPFGPAIALGAWSVGVIEEAQQWSLWV